MYFLWILFMLCLAGVDLCSLIFFFIVFLSAHVLVTECSSLQVCVNHFLPRRPVENQGKEDM